MFMLKNMFLLFRFLKRLAKKHISLLFSPRPARAHNFNSIFPWMSVSLSNVFHASSSETFYAACIKDIAKFESWPQHRDAIHFQTLTLNSFPTHIICFVFCSSRLFLTHYFLLFCRDVVAREWVRKEIIWKREGKISWMRSDFNNYAIV
jgi:hypothetical protein